MINNTTFIFNDNNDNEKYIKSDIFKKIITPTISIEYNQEHLANMMANDKQFIIQEQLVHKRINRQYHDMRARRRKLKAVQTALINNFICDIEDMKFKVIMSKNECVKFLIDKTYQKQVITEKNKCVNIKRNVIHPQTYLYLYYKGVDRFSYSKIAKDFYLNTGKEPYTIKVKGNLLYKLLFSNINQM